MNSRFSQIGFSQRICLKWLEKTANLMLAGRSKTSIYNALQELLEDQLSVSGNSPRSNREKAITIIMRIWVNPPRDLYPLHREGLKFLSQLPREIHIAVHWGMSMAVYPFWGAVAAHAGRLLRLQGKAVASQIQRRLQEQYGERDTVSRASRRVLRRFVDWGVLKETAMKGIYTAGVSVFITKEELIAWLVEAFLRAHSSDSVAMRKVLDATSLFPFRLPPISAHHLVMASQRLDVFHHGFDQDLIMLRT